MTEDATLDDDAADTPHDSLISGDTLHADSETPSSEPSIGLKRLESSVRSRLFGGTTEATRIGRFRVLDKLGEGGMGVVYSAYDDELDRKVAIKVLHAQSGGSTGRARLQREAQALAKLAHPNVVTVFEVGVHEEQVFVAMEFVRGQTLRAWVKEHDPSVRQIVEAYVQAGRGLEAAHDAGLIHRDFKPDNALIGEDGRVRVLDFGLARPEDGPADPDSSSVDAVASGDDTPLTVTGTVMGTPAYMSPEQHRGEVTDARTDIFAWSVSLWEAVYGQRPFRGSSVFELAKFISNGELTPPPSDRGVPAALKRSLEAGLRPDRDDRPSVFDAILADVEAVFAPPRRTGLFVAAGVALLAIGGAVAWSLRPDPEAQAADARPTVCKPIDEQVAGLWDDEGVAKWQARIAPHADLPWMQTGLDYMIAHESAELERWKRNYTKTCELLDTSSDADVQRIEHQRLACLTKYIHAAREIESAAEASDARLMVGTYQPAAYSLLENCENDRWVSRMPPPTLDPEDRAQELEIASMLVRALRMNSGSQYVPRKELTANALERAEALGNEPLLADALMNHGSSLQKMGDPEAQKYRERARDVAEESGYELVLLDWHFGEVFRKGNAGEDYAEDERRALGLFKRLGEPAQFRSLPQFIESHAARQAKAWETLERIHEELLANAIETYGPDSIAANNARGSFAQEIWLRNGERAFELTQARVDSLSKIYGETHPTVLWAKENHAYSHKILKRDAEATALYETVVHGFEAAGPGQTSNAGWALFQLSSLRLRNGDPAYLADARRAETLLVGEGGERTFDALRGPTSLLELHDMFRGHDDLTRERLARHDDLNADRLFLQAMILARAGDRESARASLEDAKKKLAEQLPGFINVRREMILAGWRMACLFELGDTATALTLAKPIDELVRSKPESLDAFAAWEARFGHTVVGRAMVLGGEPAGALYHLERAVEWLDSLPASEHFWFYDPMARVWLATALVETKGDRTRAAKLAAKAVELYEELGPGVERERAMAKALVAKLSK